jgi:predicted acylesterase/phospholipase RssA
MENNERPKFGLALAGASSRSMFYIGFLEVLSEHNFKVDYVSAMSGGSVIAASYGCGTLPEMKKFILGLNKEVVFSLIEDSKDKGGLYHLDKFENMIRHYTRNMRFEEIQPKMGFVATDLNSGEAVVLEIGDVAKAVVASCTLPFIFKPIPWGNKLLVDGGLVSVVPGEAARNAGMDIVVGLHLRNKMHVFSNWQIAISRIVSFFKAVLFFDRATELWQRLMINFDFYGDYSALVDKETLKQPGIFSVLGRSVDLAIASQLKNDPKTSTYDCDMLIRPDIHIPFWKKYLYFHFTDFSKSEDIYNLGREIAEEYLPKMQELIDNYDKSRRS